MASHTRRDGLAQAAAGDAGIVSSSFNTYTSKVDQQMLAWRDRVGHVVDVLPTKAQMTGGFRGSIDRHAAGDFVFTDATTDAMSLDRSVARVSTDVRRDYVFHIFVRGEVDTGTSIQKKRSAPNSVQGIVVFDMDQPFRTDRSACQVLTMFVPRAVVEATIPDADAIHGRIVQHGAPLTQLVVNHALALSRDLPAMGAAQAVRELNAGAQLLLAAFRKQASLTGDARAAVQAAVMSQVRRFVEANLNQPDLSPSSVVDALQLKRATIYRWFEHEGGLGAYIRHRRLREAADELVRFPHLHVIDIAYGLGFNSASDFTRAFRRAYGMSPQDARARALELQQASKLELTSLYGPGGR
ncbi:AraC family transcriptional regulator [Burkholderia sp. S171]|uniref:AraC family transcriptional regulator n=1 Tax=Burkholderia sp. S171 TaxID=1641860 RepID=UPI00131CC014|nr:AraC family transcriptional regulator [Burkholderia sp. S171]